MIMRVCVKSILLYGSEIWGVKEDNQIEQVQIQWLKKILGVEKSTPWYVVLQEMNEWKVWSEAVEKMVKFENRVYNRANDNIARRVIECADRENHNKTPWGKCRKDNFERMGWSLQEVRERKARGNEWVKIFVDRWKGVEGQERQAKIAQSNYNKRYQHILVCNRMPGYLTNKIMNGEEKRMIARFRCGGEERANKYWMRIENKMCVWCENGEDNWNHWSKSCLSVGWTNEEKKQAEWEIRCFAEDGKGLGLMKKLISERKKKNLT